MRRTSPSVRSYRTTSKPHSRKSPATIRVVAGLFVLPVLADLVFVQYPVERRPGNPQHTRRDTQVVAVPVEHIAQRLAFGAVFVVFQCSHRRRNCLLTLQTQINGFDLPPFGQYQAPTYTVG